MRALYQSNFNCFQELISTNNSSETLRKISSEPERILDAPNLSDNFFYNPIDWGSKNILSVCLGPYDYLWNYNNLETYFRIISTVSNIALRILWKMASV